MKVFPVAAEGMPAFSNDFGAPRSGGRSHKGNDIVAAAGTPLLAVDDGQVFFGSGDKLGGNVARLEADNGIRYLYTHLQGFAGDERRVRAGEVIGFVGNTGNAITTPPHVHFEVHQNGEVINPFPLLKAVSQVSSEIVSPKKGSMFPWLIVGLGGFLIWRAKK
jgi:murein DD-endopeptidase MepM/ murein hydrolase activator NlpD